MDKILCLLFGLCVLAIVPFIVLSVISIIPYLGYLGWLVMGLFTLTSICVSLLAIAFTFTRIGLWRSKRVSAANGVNVIVAGDIVVYRLPDGNIRNLSVEVERERARTVEALPERAASRVQNDKMDDTSIVDDSTIVELWERGSSKNNIYSALKGEVTMQYIQKVIDEHDRR